ncbi:flagellin [Alicyclobacillus macrosporangiidus]|uniref:flagellin N-terminal helical domain-containing protein n=1 Tax=Alicyclobacillus macrosporangiidus TaxID=392015 RepID=UPI00049792B7|nr:flagellin [Alicyclobacillus macrosporangiidus]
MSFAINTNVTALNVLFNLNQSQSSLQKVSNQLSSGYQINSAADDAAGLSIATKMLNQINGLNRAAQNAQDGLSMLQTMEGGLSSIQDMLARMRTLALEAANGTETTADRSQIVAELQQIQQEITRTAQTTQFNTQTLLTGLANGGITFQVGSLASGTQVITLKANAATMTATALNITATAINNIAALTSLASQQAAASALVSILDTAISTVSKFRATVGAVEDRLNFAVSNLQTESTNLSTARSRIMDTNMAAAMTNFTKEQILVNAGISMLAQANQMPGMVLKLLG